MPISQISVSLENVPGKFSEVIDYLAEHEINVIALSVAETSDLSTVRMVTNKPQQTYNILLSHGYPVRMTGVLAIEAPNHPGGLDVILGPLKELSVNINYLYTCLRTGKHTILILGVDKITETLQCLRKNQVHVYDEELYKL
jgi:hypothetical protein